jgi:plastocyanin
MSPSPRLRVALIALLFAAAAVDTPAINSSQSPNEIRISSFMFMPMELTVKAGTTVTWTNLDDEAHTVVSVTGVFRSGALDTNERFAFVFDRPGVYRFTCSLHPRMVGTVIVD